MSVFRDRVRQTGYSAEEKYFHEQQQLALEKLRARPKLKLIQGGASDSAKKRESHSRAAPGDREAGKRAA